MRSKEEIEKQLMAVEETLLGEQPELKKWDVDLILARNSNLSAEHKIRFVLKWVLGLSIKGH